jgi:ribonuclease VapC
MIVDSSALVAILQREDGHEGLEEKVRNAGWVAIGSATLAETKSVMVRRQGAPGLTAVDQILEILEIEVVPFEVEHADVAGEATVRFGKGRHPARLNYGDCMTYATARVAGEPLLFIGNDFVRTDIAAA